MEDIILFSDSSNDCVISFLNKIIELQLVKDRDLIHVLSCIAIIGDTPKKSVQNFTLLSECLKQIKYSLHSEIQWTFFEIQGV